MVFEGDTREIENIIQEENMALQHLSQEQYEAMARELIDENPDIVKQIKEKGRAGKIKWFLGQMMRKGGSQVVAIKAEAVIRQLLEIES